MGDKEILKAEYEGYFANLRKMVKAWTLIPGAPTNEFDHLVTKILSKLYQPTDLSSIKNLIKSMLVSYYGLSVTNTDVEILAEEVWNWWNAK